MNYQNRHYMNTVPMEPYQYRYVMVEEKYHARY
jgi:hypothetical protein